MMQKLSKYLIYTAIGRLCSLITLLFIINANDVTAQITAKDAGGCILTTDTWSPDGTVAGHNTYKTLLSCCGAPAKVVWSITNNRWEIVAAVEDDGIFNDLLHYNTTNTSPNPPALGIGTWQDSGYGCGSLTQFSGPYTTTVLPVTLNGFSAKSNGSFIKFEWSTTSEQNNSHFIVQASTNGSKWTDLGTVLSKAKDGSSSTPLSYSFNYSFTDIAIAGFGLLGLLLLPASRNRYIKFGIFTLAIITLISCTKDQGDIKSFEGNLKSGKHVYVRLAQYDFDGKVTFSEIINVK